MQSLAAIAAVICSFLGYSHGGWGGAAAAFALAYGGVLLLFTAIDLAWRLAVGAVVLIMILAALKNRLDWIMGMIH
jgi:hypothetical protein